MRYPLAQMQAHATALLRAFEAAGAPSEALRATSFQSASWPGGAGSPVGEQAALTLSARIYTHWMGLLPNTASARARARCEVARDALLEARRAVLVQRESLCTTLGAAAAEGIVRLRAMPPKLNPIVKALMNAVQGAGGAGACCRGARQPLEAVHVPRGHGRCVGRWRCIGRARRQGGGESVQAARAADSQSLHARPSCSHSSYSFMSVAASVAPVLPARAADGAAAAEAAARASVAAPLATAARAGATTRTGWEQP